MVFMIENEAACIALKRTLANSVTLLTEFSWLCDAYIIEFFSEDHWSKLPESWKEFFYSIDASELAAWLHNGSSKPKVIPLSLLSLRKSLNVLSLQRHSVNGINHILSYLNNSDNGNHSVCSMEWTDDDKQFLQPGKQNKIINHVFRRHVKPKKQHELSRLSHLISKLANMLSIQNVADIGAGQGHLSRLMSLGHGFNVVTMDAEGCHTSQASKFDDQAMEFMKKKNSQIILKQPSHLNLTLAPNITTEKFMNVIQPHFSSQFGMVGLHTCGNLAPTLIRMFKECNSCRFLVSLPCCYMKMYDYSNEFIGYPLSNFMKDINHKLSFEALEVACHALESYISRLKDNFQHLKVHCYRATLEAIVVGKYPLKRRLGVGSIKCTQNMTFQQYALKALERLKLNDISKDDLESEFVRNCLDQWKQVIVFYSLRLLIAPLIESVVLLDRLLYTHEHGIKACLVPIFKPIVSPRNMALIAVKHPP